MKKLLFSFAIVAISMPSFAQWSTSGNNTIHTNSGNVGIGSTNPQTTLEVNGDTFSKSFRVLGIGDNVNGAPWYGIGLSNTGLGGGAAANVIQLAGFAGLSFKTAGGQMLMNTDGNLGIGTTPTLDDRLLVNGSFKVILGNNESTKNVAGIKNLGYSGITGAQNWSLRGVYQHGDGVSLNSAGGDLDIIKSLDGNTILATKTDGSSLGYVSIGANAPRAVLDVARPLNLGETGSVLARLDEGNSNGSGTFLGVKGYATQGNSSNTPGNIKSFAIEHAFYGHTNSSINFFRGGNQLGGYLTFATNDNTEQVRILANGSMAIGTTDSHGYKLAVNGNIRAKEIKVEAAPWPDYVFKPSYKLPSLTTIKAYIDKNQHLPSMPSEAEVANEGVNLGKMVKLQTEKIEELTLYLIQQQQEINKLKRRLKKVEKN